MTYKVHSDYIRTNGQRAFATLLFVLLSSTSVISSEPSPTTSPPNILFILTEDQGAQLGALGTVGLETPHIDELAQRGILFSQAFVDVPVCSASKAAIYTGLHGHANGIPTNTPNFFKPADQLSESERNNPLYNFRRIPEEVPTLIEILHDAGYFTCVTDKLHVAPNEKFPFDKWGQATPGFAARFLADAESRKQPWFLWYNIRDPHRKFLDSHEHPIRVSPKDVEVPAFLPDTPIVRRDIAEYYDAIERADDKVGAVIEVLKSSRSSENTIIVFMGDHGPSFQRGKMSPYDFGLRVPLVFAGPNIPRGVVCDEVVGAIDLMPTLLDTARIAPPSSQHGISLKPLLQGQPNSTGHEFLVSELQHEAQQNDHGMRERSLYDGRYRLICRDRPTLIRDVNADIVTWENWGNRTYAETIAVRKQFPMQYRILAEIDNEALGGVPQALELYDTKNDPYEINNLVSDPKYRDVRNRLSTELMKWAKRTGDHSFLQMAEHHLTPSFSN